MCEFGDCVPLLSNPQAHAQAVVDCESYWVAMQWLVDRTLAVATAAAAAVADTGLEADL